MVLSYRFSDSNGFELMKKLLLLMITGILLGTSTVSYAEEKSPIASAFERMRAGDNAVARGILEPLASDGDPDAQHMLGFMEERGLGATKNLKRALELYAQAAEGGSIDAQFALGELAFLGDGVKRDYRRAGGWFRLAASKGHVQAKIRLGVMYAEGLGFEVDRKRAVELFEEAGNAGDAGAQYNMGVAYLVGQGVTQDYQKSAEWFEKSAIQGSPDAQYNLALLHDSDFLGGPNRELTAKWMSAAAEGGLPAAFVAMGLMHHDGRVQSEKKNASVTAADWFEKAARSGDPQGQFLYAVSLAEGDGRTADPAQAMVWLEKSLKVEGGLAPETRKNALKLSTDLKLSLIHI